MTPITNNLSYLVWLIIIIISISIVDISSSYIDNSSRYYFHLPFYCKSVDVLAEPFVVYSDEEEEGAGLVSLSLVVLVRKYAGFVTRFVIRFVVLVRKYVEFVARFVIRFVVSLDV